MVVNISAERVRVHCRSRPLSAEENGNGSILDVRGKNVVGLKGGDGFEFDSYLDESTGQEDVYKTVAEPIVTSVLKGYNGTVFAYGQTGSGKTYSMFGKNDGIVPRSLGHIFRVVQENEDEYEYQVKLSYVQLYCELLTDLLDSEEKSDNSLLIRECPRKGVYIEGAREVHVRSIEEAIGHIIKGDESRVRAATNMNAASSRSHACIILNVSRRKLSGKGKVTFGKLILVDLAGSERVKKALGGGGVLNPHVRFMESRSINLSLSALGNCIAALAKKNAKHVPYRDGKLTRLLKDSLGGNSMTALVLNIAPNRSSVNETKSTLQFGQRAMNVETHVSLNEEVDFKALFGNAQAEVDKKDDRIHELEIALSKLQIELNENKRAAENDRLEKDMALMKLKTVGISEETESQIEALQKEHQASLTRARETFEKQVAVAQQESDKAQDEWHRIEHDLKDEKEEHLRTCTLLREKQQQLVELESRKGDRIAELFEQLKTAKEKNTELEGQLGQAFEERNGLLQKNTRLQEELDKANEFQERGLKLMQTLTNRVEELEKKNRHESVETTPTRRAKPTTKLSKRSVLSSNNKVIPHNESSRRRMSSNNQTSSKGAVSAAILRF